MEQHHAVVRVSRRQRLAVAECATAVALIAGCRGSSGGPTEQYVPDNGSSYVPDADWRTASPGAVGLDGPRIAELRADVAAGRYGVIDGLLIVRYGYLAVEQYVNGSRSQTHTMQSVTKSVTSLLFGIARARSAAAVGDLARPVLDVFHRYVSIANVDERKRALTLGDLLTMRTGMDFWEQPYAGSPLDQLNRSADDWVKFVLDRPMTGAPGTSWSYNSGAAIVMGGVIRELTGLAPDAFARRELFGPIGVTGESWSRSPFDGLPHCGGGLFLRPIDLARVGYLVLRRGMWGDREIVSRAWLDASTQPVTRGPPVYFSDYGSGYGYFWWLFPTRRGGSDAGIIAASGSGGQWLFVVPSLDLVVAVVATSGDGLRLLYDGVLPAVRE